MCTRFRASLVPTTTRRTKILKMGKVSAKAAFLLCFAISFIDPRPLRAAYIYASTTEDGGCAITFFGDIVESDAHRFEVLANSMCDPGKSGGVLFGSGGGSLRAGLMVGEKIRQLGLETAVSYDTVCASACALAWLAGKKRNMFVTSWIGFHTSYHLEEGKPVRSQLGNEMVQHYLSGLGFPSAVFDYATHANASEMNWIRYWKAEQIGVPVHVLGEEDRYWVDQLQKNTPHREKWVDQLLQVTPN